MFNVKDNRHVFHNVVYDRKIFTPFLKHEIHSRFPFNCIVGRGFNMSTVDVSLSINFDLFSFIYTSSL